MLAVGVLRDHADGMSRQPQLLPELGIGQRPAQQHRIVLEIAQAGVAVVAEQEAQPAHAMTVIDAELGERPSLADRAQAVLHGHHPLIVRQGQAVLAPEIAFDIRHCSLLRSRREAQERLLGLLALIAQAGACFHVLAILRILGIALAFAREHPLPERIVLGVLLALVRQHPLPVRGVLGIAISPLVIVVRHCCTLRVFLRPCQHPALAGGEPHASAKRRIVCWSGRCAAMTTAAPRRETINAQLSIVLFVHDSRGKVK
jgi:hypothetical protein